MKANRNSFLFLLIILFVLTDYSNITKAQSNRDYLKVKYLNKEINVRLNYDSNPQKTKERILKNLNLKLEVKIGGMEDTTLFRPISVKTDKNENIYILDQIDCKVKKFNPQGVFIKSYGRKGKGPGETEMPTRMDVSQEGKILIVDQNLQKGVLFIDKKTFDFNYKYSPDDICFSSEKSFCVFQQMSLNIFPQIIQYDFSGNILHEYESLIDKNSVKELPPFIFTLTGEIISNYDKIIYVPKYLNHIVGFDNTGKIKFGSKTIDIFKSLPEVDIFSVPEMDMIASKAPQTDNISAINTGVVNVLFQ